MPPAPTSDRRLQSHVQRDAPVAFTFEGADYTAHPGETVAAALLAAGVLPLRPTSQAGQFRGLFCGMGACFECRLTIDGRPNQRACLVPVQAGMQVSRGV